MAYGKISGCRGSAPTVGTLTTNPPYSQGLRVDRGMADKACEERVAGQKSTEVAAGHVEYVRRSKGTFLRLRSKLRIVTG